MMAADDASGMQPDLTKHGTKMVLYCLHVVNLRRHWGLGAAASHPMLQLQNWDPFRPQVGK
jgi:hypothetical protein